MNWDDLAGRDLSPSGRAARATLFEVLGERLWEEFLKRWLELAPMLRQVAFQEMANGGNAGWFIDDHHMFVGIENLNVAGTDRAR